MSDYSSLTASQEILLAAATLSDAGQPEFSEWDLTVAAWKLNPNKFGCRGYEAEYPDHKRVMMEIMSKKRLDNPLRRGWIRRTRPNHYRLATLGLAEAQRLREASAGHPDSIRAGADIYDAVVRYADHRVFKDHCRDAEEPRTWLEVEAFLGISRHDPTHVADRLRLARNTIDQALRWLDENKQKVLRRTQGSGLTLRRDELEKLAAFTSLLQERFKIQFNALLRKGTAS